MINCHHTRADDASQCQNSIRRGVGSIHRGNTSRNPSNNSNIRLVHLTNKRRISPREGDQIFFDLAQHLRPRAPFGEAVGNPGARQAGGIWGDHKVEGVREKPQVSLRVSQVKRTKPSLPRGILGSGGEVRKSRATIPSTPSIIGVPSEGLLLSSSTIHCARISGSIEPGGATAEKYPRCLRTK